MGAWGVLAFDNDEANDWAYDLEDVEDLSLVKEAFGAVVANGDEFLDSDLGCAALAACEVLARLKGQPGYQNAYTEKVDQWVAAHPQKVPPALIAHAETIIDIVLGQESELRELWDETGNTEWQEAVEDLRKRMTS